MIQNHNKDVKNNDHSERKIIEKTHAVFSKKSLFKQNVFPYQSLIGMM